MEMKWIDSIRIKMYENSMFSNLAYIVKLANRNELLKNKVNMIKKKFNIVPELDCKKCGNSYYLDNVCCYFTKDYKAKWTCPNCSAKQYYKVKK